MKKHLPMALALGLLTLTAPLDTSPAAAGTTEACNGKPATIVIDSSNPDQQGTSGNDVVVLLDGGHDFDAGDGDDTVCSYNGQNTIRGGPGDDFLSATAEDPNTVYGGHGDDVIFLSKGGPGQTTAMGGPGDDKVTASFGGFDISLGNGDDTAIVDEVASTVVRGGPGDDTLRRRSPGEGVDSSPVQALFLGGPGRDVLSYRHFSHGGRSVVVKAWKGAAYGFGKITFTSVTGIVGSKGDDQFFGSAHHDRFWGLGGNDLMRGNGGQDFLYGGTGVDRAAGGTGRDTCVAEHRTSCELR